MKRQNNPAKIDTIYNTATQRFETSQLYLTLLEKLLTNQNFIKVHYNDKYNILQYNTITVINNKLCIALYDYYAFVNVYYFDDYGTTWSLLEEGETI